MIKNAHPIRTKTDYLADLMIVLPVAGYLVYAWHFAGSLFYADDFHLLKSVQWGQETSSLTGKIQLLYQQHQEHRIIIPRLLTLLDYYIEGFINWRSLILFANIVWCGTVFLLWKAFLSLTISRWYFIPVPWLLFHPQYYDNVTWTISILQQSDVVFLFTLLAFVCSKKKYNIALAISLIATFTHGNGIFSFPIAIVFAILDRDRQSTVRLLIAMLLVAFFYFYDFNAGQNASVSRSLADPLNLLNSFGVFFGGISLVIFKSYHFSAILGLAMTAALIGWAVVSLKKTLSGSKSQPILFDKMLWGVTAFLVITGSLVVMTRSWQGVESIAAARYLHYSSYVTCWTFLFALRIANPSLRKLTGLVGVPAAILLCLLSYLNYTPHVRFLRDQLIADESNYINHQVFLQYFPSFNENISSAYAGAIKSGVVRMEDRLNASILSETNHTDIPLIISEDSIRLEHVDGSSVAQIARIKIPSPPGREVFVVIKSGTQTPFWIPVFTQRAAYRSLLSTGIRSETGMDGSILLANLPTGSYQLGLYADGRVLWTDQYLTIPFNLPPDPS